MSCPLPGELSEDMETSSETTTSPLDTTKDTCNLGAKQISEETGTAASTYKTIQHILQHSIVNSNDTMIIYYIYYTSM